MQKKLVEALATGFYLGRAPFAPGTFGTLLGIPLAYLLSRGSPFHYMLATVVILLLAVAVSELHEQWSGQHDPGEIVIDEVVGYLVAFTWLPITWQAFLGAFLAFRLFDILKPFPINIMDKRIRGGLGTVLDDVAAGLLANLLLQLLYTHTTLLGEQLHAGISQTGF